MTPITDLNIYGTSAIHSLKKEQEVDTQIQKSAPTLKKTWTNDDKDNSTTNKILKRSLREYTQITVSVI